MNNKSKKVSVFRRISKKRLCIAVLIAAIAAAVAAAENVIRYSVEPVQLRADKPLVHLVFPA